jgi:hypothetical protein
VASKVGKLTVHTTRGRQKKSYTIGGFIIDGKFFVGKNAAAIAYGSSAPEYAIYTLDGKVLEGGFDSSRDAKRFAHTYAIREKFKI